MKLARLFNLRRFIVPTPNCGHGGTTFTYVTIAELWMCPLCIASIGALYKTCSNCGLLPPVGTQLTTTHRAGDLCTTCRREFLASRCFAQPKGT